MKIPRAADASRASRREGPHRFAEKRPRTFVLALRRFATVELPQILLSRDFRRCSIFDFCNKIGTKRTSRDVRLESVVRAKADIAAALLFRHARNMPRQLLPVTPNRVF